MKPILVFLSEARWKKQADEIMIELGNDFAKLNENPKSF